MDRTIAGGGRPFFLRSFSRLPRYGISCRCISSNHVIFPAGLSRTIITTDNKGISGVIFRSVRSIGKGIRKMDRRQFIRTGALGLLGLGTCTQLGCRSNQTAEVVKPGDKHDGRQRHGGRRDLGSAGRRGGFEPPGPALRRGPAGGVHAGRSRPTLRCGSASSAWRTRASKIWAISAKRSTSRSTSGSSTPGTFQSVSKRYVDAGLQAANLRPDEVFIPQNMRILTERMEQMQQPFDFVLIAKVTSGTTRSNANYEREYLLTWKWSMSTTASTPRNRPRSSRSTTSRPGRR